MKIRIIKIGKPAHPETKSLVEMYVTRMKPFCPIELVEEKVSEGGEKLEKWTGPGKFLVALDERGKEFSSKELAQRLQGWLDDPAIKELNFLIGGPFGISEMTRTKASALWSLSRGTLQGDIAWVVMTEQIYRAFTIQRGMPYHHE